MQCAERAPAALQATASPTTATSCLLVGSTSVPAPAAAHSGPGSRGMHQQECCHSCVPQRWSRGEIRYRSSSQPTATAAGANPDLLDAACRLSTPERCHSTRSWQPTVARLPSGCSEQGLSWACARWVKQGCLIEVAAPAPQPSCKQVCTYSPNIPIPCCMQNQRWCHPAEQQFPVVTAQTPITC